MVLEVLGHDQYRVRVDGSNRVTLRNRKHLKPLGYRRPADPLTQLPVSSMPPHSSEMPGGNVEGEQPDGSRDQQSRYSEGYLPQTPGRVTGDQSMAFATPVVVPSPARPGSVTENNSQSFQTPLKTPRRSCASESSISTRRDVMGSPIVGSPVSTQPRLPAPEVRVYHQLRPHNRSGLKEAPIDIEAPRQTRSGRLIAD